MTLALHFDCCVLTVNSCSNVLSKIKGQKTCNIFLKIEDVKGLFILLFFFYFQIFKCFDFGLIILAFFFFFKKVHAMHQLK